METMSTPIYVMSLNIGIDKVQSKPGTLIDITMNGHTDRNAINLQFCKHAKQMKTLMTSLLELGKSNFLRRKFFIA